MTIFDEIAPGADGQPRPLSVYRGRPLFIANVASACGFTPQMRDLEQLHQTYGPRGLVVLAFPSNDFFQENGRGEDLVTAACDVHGATYPVFGLTHVRGSNRHPIFTALTQVSGGILGSGVLWNFEKFLVDREGRPVDRWRSVTSPTSARVRWAIEAVL